MDGADRQAKGRSDLGVRAVSAVVMVAAAGLAFWQGGPLWTAFVVVIGLGVLWEWVGLVHGFIGSPVARGLWNGAGLIYIGFASAFMVLWRQDIARAGELLALMAAVIATDVFAYFSGRTFGGPKIAPRISPSKTWAGLLGGMAGASAVMLFAAYRQFQATWGAIDWMFVVLAGVGVAVVAQTGDFFESWMKRRAGVKDSGKLLPGHGGLLDRLDGLIAVLFVSGALFVIRTLL